MSRETGTKKKGNNRRANHVNIRKEKSQRKRNKHLQAYWKRWFRLHPELKPENRRYI
jgi:hypothetical protein